MNPVEEVVRLRQKVLYSNSTLQLPSNSSSGGVQVCYCKICLLGLNVLFCFWVVLALSVSVNLI